MVITWLVAAESLNRTSAYIGDERSLHHNFPFSSLIMTEIENFLSTEENQTSFLSILRSDIERLAVSPFQWLRYVMFAICGARGDLTKTPNGSAVDYKNTEIAENTYYYRPSSKLSFVCEIAVHSVSTSPGRCAFVDHRGLNDRITTTEGGTASRGGLRRDIIKRDGRACVITQAGEGDCDAVHLIPHSKGDGVSLWSVHIII